MSPIRLPLFLCLIMGVILTGCVDQQTSADPTQGKAQSTKSLQATTGKTFKLVIDYGDGVEKHYPKLAWREGITVLDAMKGTSGHPRGVQFATRNDANGQAAFIDQIDGVRNEGGGSDAKNWTIKINGQKSPVGAGVKELKANDVVVWKFGIFEIE